MNNIQYQQGIIISVNDLNRYIWGSISQFINHIYTNGELKDYGLDIYWADTIKEDSKNTIQFNPKTKIDLGNTNVKLDSISQLGILYNKSDGHDDFDQIASFLMLEKKYSDKIDLGINLNNIDYQEATDYKFRLAAFCCLANNKSIRILLRDTIVNKETGEVKQINEQKVLRAEDVARTYLPFCKITKSTYNQLFVKPTSNVQETVSGNEDEQKLILYIKESIKKLEEDFNKYYLSVFNRRYTTLFDKWFILAYFHSIGIPYTDKRLKGETISKTKRSDDDLVVALKTYTNNIQELSQNIIYHTDDKEGYLYVAFIKKDELSRNALKMNNAFTTIDINVKRFVEFGVMDCARRGIVPTFNKHQKNSEELELLNFFELNPTKTINLTSLDMRYAAHLGLKTFVASIKGQRGYFYVESNSSDNTKSKVELCNGNIKELSSPDFIDGTHFHVIVPVSKIEGLISAPLTQSSARSYIQHFKQILDNDTKIKVSSTDLSSILRLSNTTHIEDRNREIEELGTTIAEEHYSIDETKREIAIEIPDNDGSLYIVQNVYRLINYLQLSLNNNYFTTIILTNLSNEFIDNFWNLFNTHVIKANLRPIWKNDCAIVLMSKNLNYRIISGEEETDINALNNELKKHYCISTNFPFSESAAIKNELKYFVRPYELLIDNNNSYYLSYVERLLRKCIEGKEQGYCVRHENTYIGSKMIVVNYYEAETLFQNSFFAERFAFLIAQRLKRHRIDINEEWYIVGAGYHSDLTIRSLQSLLSGKPKTMLAIDGDEIDFQYSIEPNQRSKFFIITPIGSTLSYHDKIAAFLMRKFNVSKDNIVHHCIIIVGNKNHYLNNLDGFRTFSKGSDKQKPDIEYTFKWENIDIENRQIKLKYKNVERVDYEILVGRQNKEMDQDNWHHRIDKSITFPESYYEEKYVNQTENQSINSQNLLGFPQLDNIYLDKEKHKIELKHLKELVPYIYYGHIENHHTHYRYYIYSEGFIAKEKEKANSCLAKWMLSLKNEMHSQDPDGYLNLIITPNARIESEFVNYINHVVFANNAQIINIDAHSWKNNMTHKYKYIGDIVKNNPKVRFHYVDHALFTANTFLKTKNFLEEIIPLKEETNSPKELFSSIIVLINRVSPNVTDNIAIKKSFHTFLNLFIPESTDNINDCVLCALEVFYDRFYDKTISSDCKSIIAKNKSKITKTTFEEIKKSTEALDKNGKKQLRLFFTHELFYRIAEINDSLNISPFEKYKKTKIILDEFYFNDINSFCEQWIGKEFDQIDKTISFVKVISSPPLTRFIAVREYAHFRLLAILKDLLEKKTESCGLDDLKLLKAVLKSLSFLNSTALVRKSVILGSWRMFNGVFTTEVNKIGLNRTIEAFDEDFVKSKNEELDRFIGTMHSDLFSQKEVIEAQKKKDCLNALWNNFILFPKEVYFNIKNAILEDETKSMFLNELLRTGEECLTMEKLKENIKEKDNFQIIQEEGSMYCDEVKHQYLLFLDWLYNDTTTVLQKALSNFEKETIKDVQDNYIKNSFYSDCQDNDSSKWVLSDYQNAVTEKTIQGFRDKVVGNGNEVEYYYENLKLYNSNAEEVDYIGKLVRVLYAKLKLERLVNNSQTNIENDIKILLSVLADIMNSDRTFILFKHNEHAYYEFAVGYHNRCGKVDDWKQFEDDFLIKQPFVDKRKTIKSKEYSCSYTLIEECCVLYFANNKGIKPGRAQMQLLLLLRNSLNKYVMYIRNNGLLDVWIEKQRTNEYFTERYRKNTHNALGNLNKVSNNIFYDVKNNNSEMVQLYAIMADLHIGKIHNSLLVGQAVDYKQNCVILSYYEIKDNWELFLEYAKLYLKMFDISNFTHADFQDASFYYTDNLPFLLFQFIHNITKNTQTGFEKECKVDISMENDYIVIRNSYSTIDDKTIENIRKSLSLDFNSDILKDHISLYCINYFFYQIRGEGIFVQKNDHENTFIVKIPALKQHN